MIKHILAVLASVSMGVAHGQSLIDLDLGKGSGGGSGGTDPSTLISGVVNLALVPLALLRTQESGVGVASRSVNTGVGEYSPGQVLVKFNEVQSSKDLDEANKIIGTSKWRVVHGGKGAPQTVLFSVNEPRLKGKAVEMLAKLVSALPGVMWAEPNRLLRSFSTVNSPQPDPRVIDGSLWGLYGRGTSPYSANGANFTGGVWGNPKVDCSQVVVGVVDSGVMLEHEDLKDSIWVNPKEIAGNGIDDDSNGYVDDVNGVNFAAVGVPLGVGLLRESNFVTDGSHGTHVAGTIAATMRNGVGVAGGCPGAKIINAKFIDEAVGAGSVANAILAIDYLNNLKRSGVNIVVSNNSYGAAGFSQGLSDAVERHMKAGIVFVAAAGNDGADSSLKPIYPAMLPFPNVLSVASIDKDGKLSSFSNFGGNTRIAAPGAEVLSTIPAIAVSKGMKSSSSYGLKSGTSMAAPHVAAAIAATKAADQSLQWNELIGKVLGGAEQSDHLSGKVITNKVLEMSFIRSVVAESEKKLSIKIKK